MGAKPAILLLTLFGPGFLPALAAADENIVIGSKRFTESYLLGEIVTQSASAAGEANPIHRRGLGNTAIVFEALKSGAIDVYPEYTGTIWRELIGQQGPPNAGLMREELALQGIGMTQALGFNNTYALAMGESQAAALGVARISDLTKHSGLRLGLSHEFIGRADGWNGLRQAYGLPFTAPRGLDHGLAYEALVAGEVDVIDAYTTDAKLQEYGLRVLEDDRGYFPRYDAVLLYRLDLPARLPATFSALEQLAGRINKDDMRSMNAAAEVQGRDFSAIAAEFLGSRAENGKRRQGFLVRLVAPDLLRLTVEHLLLTFVSLAAAAAVGIPLGILAARFTEAGQAILVTAGVVQTIPSLALFAFLIPLLGTIGLAPALVALFLYSLLPIVRNTHAGLTGAPAGLRQAALALGLKPRQSLRHVELPIALPTILAGIKTSAVINVGTATIAAFIGAGGYGERIAQGLALNDHAMLLAGAVPAAALALLVHGGFEILDRWAVPEGLRASAITPNGRG